MAVIMARHFHHKPNKYLVYRKIMLTQLPYDHDQDCPSLILSKWIIQHRMIIELKWTSVHWCLAVLLWKWYTFEILLNFPRNLRYMNILRKSMRKYWIVLDTTLCDKVCQWHGTGQWFSPGAPFSSTNKTDSHDIIEILLKVALNTINQTKP
jgi:hypothetical protein